ncbi:MAG: hypothetical protein QM751_05250 [Paludibacteraceae bacterium]
MISDVDTYLLSNIMQNRISSLNRHRLLHSHVNEAKKVTLREVREKDYQNKPENPDVDMCKNKGDLE